MKTGNPHFRSLGPARRPSRATLVGLVTAAGLAVTTALAAAPASADPATDTTPPDAPAVASADFPASGSGLSGKHAHENGDFALSAVDPDNGSGIASFEWSLNTLLPAAGAAAVPADANSSATLTQLAIGQWGTNVLYVRAVDNAGNRSTTTAYTFFAPDDPTAKTTLGDITRDGYTDLLLAGPGGDLRVYSSNADPANGGILGSNAASSPNGTSWAGVRTTHRGGNGSRADDLWAHEPGATSLYLYKNTANLTGGPATYGGQYFTPAGGQRALSPRPSATKCTNALTAQPCGSEYAADWSRVRQLLAVGDVDGTQAPAVPRNDLLTVEDDGAGNYNLWLFKGTATTGVLTDPKLIGTGSWGARTVIAPGDTDADGLPDLWVRDTADGNLYEYRGARNPDGTPDFTAYGDDSRRTLIGTGFTTAAAPALLSDGDRNGDGFADLWSIDTANATVSEYGGQDRAGGSALKAPVLYAQL
ncbi:MAG: hypothetical protein HOU01_14285 [Streptomycetaceae bacterium]|nr:hypothetical protein [Streptomycetaceae bacterium]